MFGRWSGPASILGRVMREAAVAKAWVMGGSAKAPVGNNERERRVGGRVGDGAASV